MKPVWIVFQSNDQIYWFLKWLNSTVTSDFYSFNTKASSNPYCYLFTFYSIDRDEFLKSLFLFKLSSLESFTFRDYRDHQTDELFVHINSEK